MILYLAATQAAKANALSAKDNSSIPLFVLLVPIIFALFNIVMAYLGSSRYKRLRVTTREHEWLLQQKANCLAFMRTRLSGPLADIQKHITKLKDDSKISDANSKKLTESINISTARVENLTKELQRSTLHVTQESVDIIPFYRSATTLIVLAMTVFVIAVVNSVLATTKVVTLTFGMLMAQVGVFLLATTVVLVTNRYKKVSDQLIMHSKATLGLQQRMDDAKDHLIALVIKIISADIIELKQSIGLFVSKEDQAPLKRPLKQIDMVIERLELLNNVETRLLKSDVRLLNVEDLVEDVFRTYQAELNNRGLQVEHFHRVGASKIQPSVIQDYSLLKLALSEVFKNALQHSPPRGLIKVISEHGLTSSSLTIVDQGSGLKLKHNSIKPFMSEGAQSESDNVGIGLYLADQVMHILGGELQIMSIKEAGASIKLTFINGYVR